ncbi:MAG: alpha/beta fold hydrolase [Rhodoferax sp.]|nr:alpha/beta fold hydrolase [Rhodoferax sp.]
MCIVSGPVPSSATPLGVIGYRQAGALAFTRWVLLHGIGSGSASWSAQLAAVPPDLPGLLAWDAPGYGDSEGLRLPDDAWPDATAYASRLWAWLDALGLVQPLTLVGHSLGALMAARAAVLQPQRVAALVLLAPAQGHARLDAAQRERLLHDRLSALATLGPAGLAQQRGAAMLTPDAPADQLALVQTVMARIRPRGYIHAARMLAGGDLLADLAQLRCPVQVASGSADRITPPAGCQQVAAAAGVPWTDLGPVGHACPLQAGPAVNALLGLTSVGAA